MCFSPSTARTRGAAGVPWRVVPHQSARAIRAATSGGRREGPPVAPLPPEGTVHRPSSHAVRAAPDASVISHETILPFPFREGG